MINLISDTVTKPTPGMLAYMMRAETGDDVFGEDPSVNALQERVADMFGKEAALFCPSGTMTNQIAIKVNTKPLDEIICDVDSHVYQSETGGYAFNSGVAINLIQGTNGKITAGQVSTSIKPGFDWQPLSKLVVIENTNNKGGGSYYTLDEIIPIASLCRQKGLRMHLDGARLFNALAETHEDTKTWGSYFDTISVCMSKGLGAPVGSLLIGEKDLIREARRFRKVMGGGMRQAGYLAAAADYALDHHMVRLKDDNDRAKQIGEILHTMPYVKYLKPVQTNIVIFQLQDNIKDDDFLVLLKTKGILAAPFGENTIRFVLHLDITEDMMFSICDTLPKLV
ncbi:MAG: aminotransferase class I/II-fold pyridoxal phosphate-dependent enzyme [Saprospiraceae bacterium]|nr:aminotransferase class I/II-fold pyridoxal phosphate-dependent enzyme [Saprospiraceae bacterium]